MTCEHLIELEQAIIEAGFRETLRGRAWSQNCREWVYFDCFLPLETIHQKFNLARAFRNTPIAARMMGRKPVSSAPNIMTASWAIIPSPGWWPGFLR